MDPCIFENFVYFSTWLCRNLGIIINFWHSSLLSSQNPVWQLFFGKWFPSVLDEFKIIFSYPWCAEIEVLSGSFTSKFSCLPWTLEASLKRSFIYIFTTHLLSYLFLRYLLGSGQNLFQCLLSIRGFQIVSHWQASW